jgi:hypothetical protein
VWIYCAGTLLQKSLFLLAKFASNIDLHVVIHDAVAHIVETAEHNVYANSGSLVL